MEVAWDGRGVGGLVVGLKKPSRGMDLFGFNKDLKILGGLIWRHSHLGRLFFAYAGHNVY